MAEELLNQGMENGKGQEVDSLSWDCLVDHFGIILSPLSAQIDIYQEHNELDPLYYLMKPLEHELFQKLRYLADMVDRDIGRIEIGKDLEEDHPQKARILSKYKPMNDQVSHCGRHVFAYEKQALREFLEFNLRPFHTLRRLLFDSAVEQKFDLARLTIEPLLEDLQRRFNRLSKVIKRDLGELTIKTTNTTVKEVCLNGQTFRKSPQEEEASLQSTRPARTLEDLKKETQDIKWKTIRMVCEELISTNAPDQMLGECVRSIATRQ
ncbi:MAG: hypothetical protein K9K64_16865 [Desulfohalobiaceae bacterium]|nr:hypothetical protein [Desulfohalobiaceae bacterium]